MNPGEKEYEEDVVPLTNVEHVVLEGSAPRSHSKVMSEESIHQKYSIPISTSSSEFHLDSFFSNAYFGVSEEEYEDQSMSSMLENVGSLPSMSAHRFDSESLIPSVEEHGEKTPSRGQKEPERRHSETRFYTKNVTPNGEYIVPLTIVEHGVLQGSAPRSQTKVMSEESFQLKSSISSNSISAFHVDPFVNNDSGSSYEDQRIRLSINVAHVAQDQEMYSEKRFYSKSEDEYEENIVPVPTIVENVVLEGSASRSHSKVSEEEYEDQSRSSIVDPVSSLPSMSAPRFVSESLIPSEEVHRNKAPSRGGEKREQAKKKSEKRFYTETVNPSRGEYEEDIVPLTIVEHGVLKGSVPRFHSEVMLEESNHEKDSIPSNSSSEFHLGSFFNNASGISPRVEPAEAQQKKMNNEVWIDIKQLAKSVSEEFRALHPLSNRCCIYRVPERLRQLNGKAYTPQLVSIGPLHHGKKELEKMEEHKIRYLGEFLEYGDLNIDDVIQVIKENEPDLRDCYAENLAHLTSEAFVKMMLLDATFIIMLMLKYCEANLRTTTDRIFHKPWMINDVITDMVFLENQIPFFIFKRLFKLLPYSSRAKKSLIEVTHEFFKGQWNSWVTDDILEKITPSAVEHFVDFLSKCQKIKRNKSTKKFKTLAIPSALELHQAGVKFKVGSTQKLHDIKFQAGTLEIPPLRITDKTEVFLKNLLAFEDCHCHDNSLGDYIFMINLLVNSSNDAEILVKEGIIENWLHDTDAAVSLVHNLVKGVYITSNEFYFFDVVEQLNEYCAMSWPRWKANLKQNYFNNPWASISVIVAGILLILTIIQTVCSIMQV